MNKYYFGYNKFNGLTFTVKWCEEDGKPVGGKPNKILQQHEIDYDQFRNTPFTVLEVLHPLKPEVEEPEPKV